MASTIPLWVVPSGILNKQVALAYGAATESADGTTVPIVYGNAQIQGKVFAAKYTAATGKWTVGVLWCVGQCNSIVATYMNGAAPVSGVTVNNYLGTTSQTADPLLSAAISGYADTLIVSHPSGNLGLCYSVYQYTTAQYANLPTFIAEIQGRLVFQPSSGTTIYSASPALALRDMITSPHFGLGQSIVDSTVTAVQTDNSATVITEARRLLGLVVSDVATTEEWIAILQTYAGCWAFKRGNTWVLVSDRPRSSDATLTKADMVGGSLTIGMADSANVPTVVRVAYTDKTTTIWREREAIAMLTGVSSGTVPRRESFVRLPGVTRYSQAFREAQERLDKLQRTLNVEFTGFDEQLARETGDVITVTHPYGLSARTLRIVQDPVLISPGRVRVVAVDYNASDYDDTEPTATYGATDGVIGDPTMFPSAGATYSSTANILNERHGDFENSQACDFRGHQTNFGSSVSLMHLIAGVSFMGRMAMEVYQGDSRGLTYDFGPTALSWTSSNITVSTNSFSVTLTATGTDPQFISPTFSVAGATYYRVLVRFKRLAGSGWDGSLFYATSGGHSFSGSFIKQISDPTSGAGTNWVYGEWRMDALTVGGTDWTTHTITQMRIDFGAGSGDNFEVDYVVIDGANNVNEEWGYNLCGDDTSGGSTAQFKDSLVFPPSRRWMLIAAFATNTPDVYYPRAELHAALYKAASGGTLIVDRTHPTSLVQPSPYFSADPAYQLLAFELDLRANTTDVKGFVRVYMKLKSGSFGYTVLRLDRCMLIDVTETPQITETNFPTQWVPAGGSYFGDARRRPKPGATTRSATTLLADPHIWNWVGDAVEHRFYGTFYYTAGATPAIKVQLLLNGSLSTFSATIYGNDANGGAVNMVSGNWHTTPIVFAGGAGTGVISFECVFTASGMFTLDFGWAPNGAGSATLGRASFCTLERTGII